MKKQVLTTALLITVYASSVAATTYMLVVSFTSISNKFIDAARPLFTLS